MAVAISAMMGLGRERLLARRKRGLRVRLCLCVCLFVCVSVCVLSRHESSQYGFRSSERCLRCLDPRVRTLGRVPLVCVCRVGTPPAPAR